MIISRYLTDEHRLCDTKFADAEKAVVSNDWQEAEEKFLDFSNQALTHFAREEQELFPDFEAQTGTSEGPTQVMKYEHDQVRGLIGKMAEAIESQDKDAYLSLCESMMILLQQHNMKEEQMLYAMCDRTFQPDQKEDIISKMKEVEL